MARATLAALAFLGLFYAVSAWAMTVVVGPYRVVDSARDPTSGLPFRVLEVHYGVGVALLGTAILVTNVWAGHRDTTVTCAAGCSTCPPLRRSSSRNANRRTAGGVRSSLGGAAHVIPVTSWSRMTTSPPRPAS